MADDEEIGSVPAGDGGRGPDPAPEGASVTRHWGEPGQPESIRGERRWPMAVAVLFLVGLPFLLPSRLTMRPSWVVPGLELLLLATLIVGDPGRIDRRATWLRRLSLVLVGLLLMSALGSTVLLLYELATGSPQLATASALLSSGALVWVGTNIAFAFLYWELDGGGPAARAHGMPRYPDLAFPEQLSPELAPPDWRPEFIDYLYLGMTNALAFSPTDVMPLAHWAKAAMALQSLASLAILGLIVARAVNILQ